MTDAPQCKNCKATSAESTPPAPSIENSGRCFAIVEMALRAWGLVAFPDTPPYVVDLLRPTAGHGVASA